MWKNANEYLPVIQHKTQFRVDQRPEHKARYTESNKKKKTDNSVEFIETEKHFLNEAPLFQTLTSTTINGTSQN